MDPAKMVVVENEFFKIIELARDLEELLLDSMDWFLKKIGLMNITVWLNTNKDGEDSFESGAYMKHTIKDGPEQKKLLHEFVTFDLYNNDFAKFNPLNGKFPQWMSQSNFAGHEIVARRCKYIAETLSIIVLSRRIPSGASSAFSEDDSELFEMVSRIFPTGVRRVTRGSEESEKEEKRLRSKRKKEIDKADWWKRGEPPPF